MAALFHSNQKNSSGQAPPVLSDKFYKPFFFFLLPLQRKLREISTKYQLFQKPANFEQRMLDCKRVLEGAKAELHILGVKDLDPEKIQSHLSGCMVRAETVVYC